MMTAMLHSIISIQIPAMIVASALQPAGRDPGFGDIDIKRGRQVKKHQTHAVHFASVVLAGESMRALVEKTDHQEHPPELHQV